MHLSIVTPTSNHYETAKLCIKNKKHVFIEKPITVNLKQADILLKLGMENSVIIQVGHIERLNPALLALKKYDIHPTFFRNTKTRSLYFKRIRCTSSAG